MDFKNLCKTSKKPHNYKRSFLDKFFNNQTINNSLKNIIIRLNKSFALKNYLP